MLAKRFEHILHDLGMAGLEHPRSHFETALSVTFSFCASSNCVHPLSFLNSEMNAPNF